MLRDMKRAGMSALNVGTVDVTGKRDKSPGSGFRSRRTSPVHLPRGSRCASNPFMERRRSFPDCLALAAVGPLLSFDR
jgi:hypothetical protein